MNTKVKDQTEKKSSKRKLNGDKADLPSKCIKTETDKVGENELGHNNSLVKGKKKKKEKTKRSSDKPLGNDSVSDLHHGNTHETVVLTDCKKENKKKTKRKKNKKPNAKNIASDDPSSKEGDEEKTDIAKNAALLYLKKWQNDREHWHFQKVRQVWLLQHIYQSDLVPETVFPVLLDYLDGLQGKARALTVEKAEKMMQVFEENSDESDEKTEPDTTRSDQKVTGTTIYEQMERARQLIQRLSS